jgi:hypothetical protein
MWCNVRTSRIPHGFVSTWLVSSMLSVSTIPICKYIKNIFMVGWYIDVHRCIALDGHRGSYMGDHLGDYLGDYLGYG